MYFVQKGLIIIAVCTYHSKHFISRPVACLCVSPAARPAALRSLSSFDGGLALALPRSRFCVGRRKEGGLSARLAQVEDDWFLAPLATRCTALVLHSSSSTLPSALHQSAASRAKAQHLGITKGLRREKQSSTHGYECKTEFNVTC